MTLKDALKLHNGDEVVVKRTKEIQTVVEVEFVPEEQTNNRAAGLSVRLTDGNWYGYKEIR